MTKAKWWIPLAALGLAACAKEPLLPRSFQAEMLATLDPARVKLSATGVGKKFEWAVHDAQRAAMARIIQDLVQSPDEKTRFDFVAADIYGNQVKYVEAWTLQDRRVQPDGEIRVRGEAVVNRRQIEDDLVRLNVIKERRALLSELQNPNVAVLADDGIARAPWTPFAINHAASYLTQRKYEVIDLDQMRNIERMSADLKGVAGIPTDAKAVIALQAGADVYTVFDVRLDTQAIGKDAEVKASASVKAFETTTARQIGAASGFSKGYAKTAGAEEKAIAEALGDAFDRVLANINDYWKDDLKNGNQFLVTVNGDFGPTAQNARRAVYEAVRASSKEMKETLATDKTLNYRLWASTSNTELLFGLQDKIAAKLPGARLEEVTTNRKLLVLKLVR